VENKEPFAHKQWCKQPFQPRPYVVLSDFAITTNVPQEVCEASSSLQGQHWMPQPAPLLVAAARVSVLRRATCSNVQLTHFGSCSLSI